MINRRTFLQNVALVASAPAFTNLILISSNAQPVTAPRNSFRPQSAAGNVVFKINGWDCPCENEDNQVWMNINGSWRTAWR
jgi:hypothetical protein